MTPTDALTISKAPVRVAIVGARGYAGLELARILLKHPQVDLVACSASKDFHLADYFNGPTAQLAERVRTVPTDDLLRLAGGLDVVFLATPVSVSIELAPKLLELGLDVIDLSGAFRLCGRDRDESLALYEKWYQVEHGAPSLLPEATYGLIPWVKPVKKSGPRLIANPGCFASAILLALLPLLKDGVIDPDSIVIDAKSGASGAGRKAEERLLYNEVEGICLPYRVGLHQHAPEITRFARQFGEVEVDAHFTPHLLPIRRGIIAGIYARGAKLATGDLAARVGASFAAHYGHDPLITVRSLHEGGGEAHLSLRRVVGSARTHLAFRTDGNKLYLFSLIDNLLKGAASQAVENLNQLIGLATETGLTDLEGVL